MHESNKINLKSNVVNIFTGYPIDETPSRKYLLLSPELDGLRCCSALLLLGNKMKTAALTL